MKREPLNQSLRLRAGQRDVERLDQIAQVYETSGSQVVRRLIRERAEELFGSDSPGVSGSHVGVA